MEPQSESEEQTAPGAFFAQLPPMQKFPVEQSASIAQVVLHAPLVSQTYALQGAVVPAWQVPRPSHLPAAVAVPEVQLFMPQTVPDA